MSIAVDFDGVLSNTIKKWIEIFHKDYSEKYPNLQLSYNKIKEFDFYKMYNITHNDSRQIFQTMLGAMELIRADRIHAVSKNKNIIRYA